MYKTNYKLTKAQQTSQFAESSHPTQQTLYSFYISLLESKSIEPQDIQNSLFLRQHILSLSDLYSITTSSGPQIKSILFQHKFPPHLSATNYLFLYFLKKHQTIQALIDSFYHYDQYAVTDEDLKDRINENFLNCLHSTQVKRRDLTEMSDLDLIGSICVRERLTFFNYLSERDSRGTQDIKEYINKSYVRTFKGRGYYDKSLRNAEASCRLEDCFEMYSI